MKRVRNPRSEGRRIFRNLMNLPPLASDNMASDQMTSNNIEVDPQASNNMQRVSNITQVDSGHMASDILQVDDSSDASDNMAMSSENEAYKIMRV
ncbi:hypothetical protein TNCV_1420511 [Trichonephila clavipes]|nr:hypothetical protein TNCV_1420511 [Trichonephila clavipes]